MNKTLIFTTLVLILGLSFVQTHDVTDGAATVLDEANFNNHVNSSDSWLIMFYAPWCGHCKSAMPKFQEFAKMAHGHVNVGLVDCTVNTNLRDRFSVQGFPTILYVHQGKVYTYKGNRTVEDWGKFTKEGYKTAEVDEFPLEASTMKNIKKTGTEIWKGVSKLMQDQPYIFGGVIGAMILLCGLTCWCSSKVDVAPQEGKVGDENENRGRLQTTDETRAAKSDASASGEREGSVSKAPRSNKPKQE